MKITTQFYFTEHEILHTLGFVVGSITLTRHIGSHFLAGVREIFGGEVRGYTSLLENASNKALQRIINAAEEKSANAIVGLQITTSNIAPGAIDVLVYGTAVVIKMDE